MPNQTKIINAVNYCLKQKSNIDFELNDDGICQGLAGLYVKYSLENKAKEFFKILNRLSKLPKNYKLGDNLVLDKFIIQIEEVFRPGTYSSNQLQQADHEHILHIKNKPLRNEFSLGLITHQACWVTILEELSVNNRSYDIGSHNHAIAMSYKNGIYTVYDPNYEEDSKEFHCAKDVIQEFKKCLFYSNDVFGLSVRVFAHPEESLFLDYPEHSTLHELAFDYDISIKRQSIVDGQTFQSAKFAALARDSKTIAYLFEKKAVLLGALATELRQSIFNRLLLNEPPSEETKIAILKSISCNIGVYNAGILQELLKYFNNNFTSPEEQQALKDHLQYTFRSMAENSSIMTKQKCNYKDLLTLCEDYNIVNAVLTQYNHLKILTLFNEEHCLEKFIFELPLEQLIKQIKQATTLNQHEVLDLLLKQLKKLNPDLTKTAFFTEDLIEKIDALTLEKVLNAGFVADFKNPNLLSLASLRKDKTIFERYARSFSAQEKNDIWTRIDKNESELLDLESKIGPIYLINVLIFLEKYNQIKTSWNDSISKECVEVALIDAIAQGASISSFLKEKLDRKESALDSVAVTMLVQKALDDKNINILTTLAELKYNVFQDGIDLKTILRLCYDYNDFSAIEISLDASSLEIKKRVLETSINNNFQAVMAICRNKPEILSAVLTDLIRMPDSINRTMSFYKINNELSNHSYKLPIMLNQEELKPFISYCLHNKLYKLANVLSSQVLWGDADLELKELFSDLVESNNELGLIEWVKIRPDLGQDPEFFNVLVQKNLLNVISYLMSQDVKIDETLYPSLLQEALDKGNKNLINTLLQKGLITPETKLNPLLAELLKEAIRNGRTQSIEPFIQSKIDFGLDFKVLFHWSCECKQPEIANALLARNIDFKKEEITQALKQLFGTKSSSELFEVFYQKAYDKFYALLFSPRIALMQSIKNPEQDEQFLHTQQLALMLPIEKSELNKKTTNTKYLADLKRSVEEKKPRIFRMLFEQSDFIPALDHEIIEFLKDPFLPPRLFSFFEKKYELDKLVTFAIKNKEWVAVANLIERHKMSDFGEEIQLELCKKDKAQAIVKAFIDNFKGHFEEEDVKTRVFTNLYTNSNPTALSLLATFHDEETQKAIGEAIQQPAINLSTIEDNNKAEKAARDALSKALKECSSYIKIKNINLDDPIKNTVLVNLFAKIKALKAQANIVTKQDLNFLSEKQQNLLNQLSENHRFKKASQFEWTLLCVIKEFNLVENPLSKLLGDNQQRFNRALESLKEELSLQKLPNSFILPDIKRLIDTAPAKNYSAARNALAKNLGIENEYVKKLGSFWDAIEEMKAYGLTLPDNEKTVVLDLHKELISNLNQFIFENQKAVPTADKFKQFENNFNVELHSKNDEMSEHRDNWGLILYNIGIALTLVGLAAIAVQLISSTIQTGRASFFGFRTQRQEYLDKIQESLKEVDSSVNKSPKAN